jgi:hypothetical protein
MFFNNQEEDPSPVSDAELLAQIKEKVQIAKTKIDQAQEMVNDTMAAEQHEEQ